MSDAASVGSRDEYLVEKGIVDRAEAITVCAAILELLRPKLVAATVDAYSDFPDELPVEAATAERWLRDRGRALGHRDPGMGIDLDLFDPEQWTVLSSYAPWSINVELLGEAKLELGVS